MDIFDPVVLKFANKVLEEAQKLEGGLKIGPEITVYGWDAEDLLYEYRSKAQEIIGSVLYPFQAIADTLSNIQYCIDNVYIYVEEQPEPLDPEDVDFCQVWNDRSPY